jgi:hypothetical protein
MIHVKIRTTPTKKAGKIIQSFGRCSHLQDEGADTYMGNPHALDNLLKELRSFEDMIQGSESVEDMGYEDMIIQVCRARIEEAVLRAGESLSSLAQLLHGRLHEQHQPSHSPSPGGPRNSRDPRGGQCGSPRDHQGRAPPRCPSWRASCVWSESLIRPSSKPSITSRSSVGLGLGHCS